MIVNIRRFIKKLLPGVRILLYHRVIGLPSDPQCLAVSPEHFLEQMEVLKQLYTVVDLEEILNRASRKRDNSKLIALTFDDGYADNYQHALPVLIKYGFPVTIFVVANHVGTNLEYWWDDLEKLLLIAPASQPLELEIAGKFYRWQLDPDNMAINQNASWNVLSTTTPDTRQQAYIELHQLVRHLTLDDRHTVMVRISAWAGHGIVGRQEFRSLNEAEIIDLAKSGLVQIGSHTNFHSRLSDLSAKDQSQEIQGSKLLLETILQKSVSRFSYPFGSRLDYTRRTVDLVQQAGYKLACSNFPGKVYPLTDHFQLPRLLVRDWAGDEFARWLEEQQSV